jgi:outer membrane beta-barrel protein
LATIVNNTFIYSFLATGMMTYHFSEALAVEAQGGYALNADRADKTKLNERFNIKTILLRPESVANGRLSWTPSYGKFHLTASRIVYFDTYLSLGGGVTGVKYLYDYCESNAPAAASKSYPTVVLGLGQRYFIDESSSIRIGLDVQRVMVDTADGQCFPSDEHVTKPTDNLLFFAAWSYYL